MKSLLRYLAILLVSVASVGTAQKPLNPKIDSLFPESPTNYLTDVAHAVRNPDVVNNQLKVIQNKDHISMVAVTLPTIRDYEPYEVAMEIGRKWKVATKNDSLTAVTHNAGAVILLVMDKHKCFISTATGTEGYVTDATAGRLCAEQKDNFRAGDFGTGIVNIANGIASRGETEAATVATVRRPTPDTPTNWTPILLWSGGILAVIVGFFWWLAAATAKADEEARQREAEEYAQRQAELAKMRAAELKRQREEEAREKARWDALTPEQQKEELRVREEQRIERERLAAIAAAEAAVRRKKQEEEDEERRRNSSSSYSSYDYGSSSSSSDSSSSSSSSDFGFSSGGSDSFSGGGGGSDW